MVVVEGYEGDDGNTETLVCRCELMIGWLLVVVLYVLGQGG